MYQNEPEVQVRRNLGPQLPPRTAAPPAVAISDGLIDACSVGGSSAYSRIVDYRRQSLRGKSKKAAVNKEKNSRNSAIEVEVGSGGSNLACLRDARLWLVAQTVCIVAFVVAWLLLARLLPPVSPSHQRWRQQHRTWMRLTLDRNRLAWCSHKLDNGCLKNDTRGGLVYLTAGQPFGPLVDGSDGGGGGATSMAWLEHRELQGQLGKLETALMVNQSAVYTIYAQVTFAASDIMDMPVEASVRVNGTNWLHCEQSPNMENKRGNRCLIYGTRWLGTSDRLTFFSKDSYREVDAKETEIYFYLESRN